MRLEWSDDGDGGLVATHDHFEDTIEVKIVDYGCGADGIALSCGSLEMSVDGLADRDDCKLFAERLVGPFIALINAVSFAASEAERDTLPRTVCTPVDVDGNGSPTT